MTDPKHDGIVGAGSSALRQFMFARRTDARALADALPLDSTLSQIIDQDIIPQLLTFASPVSPMLHSDVETLDEECEEQFESALDEGPYGKAPSALELPALMEEIETLIKDGASVESVMLDLLTPTAQRLGEMWIDDTCDFFDVTLGLWRLQHIMREVSSRHPSENSAGVEAPPRALFAPMPGDQHYFGSMMLDEVFTRAGWESSYLARPMRRELLDRLRNESVDLVGLTLSRDCPSSAIVTLIRSMRAESANPHLKVLIGGRMVNSNPAIVAEVGADGTGADARAALDAAERLVRSPAVRVPSAK